MISFARIFAAPSSSDDSERALKFSLARSIFTSRTTSEINELEFEDDEEAGVVTFGVVVTAFVVVFAGVVVFIGTVVVGGAVVFIGTVVTAGDFVVTVCFDVIGVVAFVVVSDIYDSVSVTVKSIASDSDEFSDVMLSSDWLF